VHSDGERWSQGSVALAPTSREGTLSNAPRCSATAALLRMRPEHHDLRSGRQQSQVGSSAATATNRSGRRRHGTTAVQLASPTGLRRLPVPIHQRLRDLVDAVANRASTSNTAAT
jgi:hypothetical protein